MLNSNWWNYASDRRMDRQTYPRSLLLRPCCIPPYTMSCYLGLLEKLIKFLQLVKQGKERDRNTQTIFSEESFFSMAIFLGIVLVLFHKIIKNLPLIYMKLPFKENHIGSAVSEILPYKQTHTHIHPVTFIQGLFPVNCSKIFT